MSNNYIDELFDNLRRDPFNSDSSNVTSYELQDDFLNDPVGPEGWIADGVISDTELIDGSTLIASVAALPTLPDTDYPVGKVVYLTTDGKLYRNVADVWTAAVPAVDITGEITETQIATGAITTPKIAANAVVAEKIAANAVTTDKLNANAVTAGKIAVATITSNEIASGTITANNIASGTITAANMVAGTITAASGIIADAAITNAKIADATITNAKLVDATITAAKIADATITNAKIADATITSAKIDNLVASKITNDPAGVGLMIKGLGTGVDAGFGGVNDALIWAGYNATSVDNAYANATNSIYLSPTAFTPIDPGSAGTSGIEILGEDGVNVSAPYVTITADMGVQVGENYAYNDGIGNYITVDSGGPHMYSDTTTTVETWDATGAEPTLTVLGNGDGIPETISLVVGASIAADGDLILGLGDTSTVGAIKFKAGEGGQIRTFNATAGNDTIAVRNTANNAYAPIVASGFFPDQGTRNFSDDGTRLTASSAFRAGGIIEARSSTTTGAQVRSMRSDNTYCGFYWDGSRMQITDPITVAGNITATTLATASAGNIYTISTAANIFSRFTSSRRWKNNIEDADAATLEAAKKLKAKHFNSLHAVDQNKRLLGFIVEEVAETGLDCAIQYDEEGLPYAYDHNVLIAALVVRLEDAERRIAELEAKND